MTGLPRARRSGRVEREPRREHLGEQHDAGAGRGRCGDHRGQPVEVRRPVVPHDVVLDGGDANRRHGRNPSASRSTASSITSSRLQHANRTRCRPCSGRRRTPRSGWRRRHSGRQRAAERHAVAVGSDRPDVDGHEVGRLGHERREAGRAQPGDEVIRARLQLGGQTRRSTRRAARARPRSPVGTGRRSRR